jgi:hypothetical protein
VPDHPPEQHEGDQEGGATPGADELESEAGFLIHGSLLPIDFRLIADCARYHVDESSDVKM